MEKSKDDAPAILLVYSLIIYCPARVRRGRFIAGASIFPHESSTKRKLNYLDNTHVRLELNCAL